MTDYLLIFPPSRLSKKMMFASRGNRKEKIVPCISTPTEARGCDPPGRIASKYKTRAGESTIYSTTIF